MLAGIACLQMQSHVDGLTDSQNMGAEAMKRHLRLVLAGLFTLSTIVVSFGHADDGTPSTPRTFKGKITSIKDGKLTVESESGVRRQFRINGKLKSLVKNSAKGDPLQNDAELTIRTNAFGKVMHVEMKSPEVTPIQARSKPRLRGPKAIRRPKSLRRPKPLRRPTAIEGQRGQQSQPTSNAAPGNGSGGGTPGTKGGSGGGGSSSGGRAGVSGGKRDNSRSNKPNKGGQRQPTPNALRGVPATGLPLNGGDSQNTPATSSGNGASPVDDTVGGKTVPITDNQKGTDNTDNVQTFVPNSNEKVPGRLHWEHAKYVGAFRLPYKPGGVKKLSYSAAATAYSAARNSLFVAGHVQDNLVAEFSIPTPKDVGKDAKRTGELPMARVLRALGSPLGSLRVTTKTQVDIGGLAVLPVDGKDRLAWVQYDTYNTSGRDYSSHGFCELDFSAPRGMWNIASAPSNMSAGYLCVPNPAAMNGALKGMNLLTGQAGISGMGSGSWGPALFATKLGSPLPQTNADLPTKPLVYFPTDHRYPGWNLANRVRGAAWIHTTKDQAVAFLVTVGRGKFWYGEGKSYPYYPGGDPWDSAKGNHAPPYAVELWLFDVKDLAAVAAGTKKPWTPRPYAIVDLSKTLIPGNPKRSHMGMAYNAKDRMLYITWADVDRSQSKYSGSPIVSVFSIK